jgi:SM-20-related protein
MDELLLPYVQIRDFLPQAELEELLDYVLSHPHKFKPATVGNGDLSLLKPNVRVALTWGNLGRLDAPLQARFRDALPFLMESAGIPAPAPDRLEVGLAAHGDGAFYRPHIDLVIGEEAKSPSSESGRVLSAVYYFHAEPKRFSGGELRLFRLGTESGFVDIEPLQNSLIAFHSWMRHEVRPVAVPSGEFRDYRFAINCWYGRPR